MHNLKISDKELLIIDRALQVFCMAVDAVSDEWSDNDLNILSNLSGEIARLAKTDRIERIAKNAEDKDRRK